MISPRDAAQVRSREKTSRLCPTMANLSLVVVIRPTYSVEDDLVSRGYFIYTPFSTTPVAFIFKNTDPIPRSHQRHAASATTSMDVSPASSDQGLFPVLSRPL